MDNEKIVLCFIKGDETVVFESKLVPRIGAKVKLYPGIRVKLYPRTTQHGIEGKVVDIEYTYSEFCSIVDIYLE